ncbi:MAG TPA: EamA family transporter RarD [Steroidobacteraceae bacterium]|nr:EamA family transporter RarD [Steroidobacteraceae bacterium]
MTPARLAPRGLAAASAAFVIWGLFPLYLRPLSAVPATQIIAHRVAWSCLFVLALMLARGELGRLRAALVNPRLLARLALTALLITINWLVYVWSVAHAHVVEASLGYFINPLVNVALGVVVLRERLNRMQSLAIALAALGVVYLTVLAGRPPWIACVLGVTFSLYGLTRKVISVDALPGLAAETLLLLPLALAYLAWCRLEGTAAFGAGAPGVTALLVGCGLVTAVPLFLFAYGARVLPYSTVGVLQYIGPSLQLLCGVLVFRESFTAARAVGFALIWAALAVYAADGLWRSRAAARALARA